MHSARPDAERVPAAAPAGTSTCPSGGQQARWFHLRARGSEEGPRGLGVGGAAGYAAVGGLPPRARDWKTTANISPLLKLGCRRFTMLH